jgi:histidinol-phosphatase
MNSRELLARLEFAINIAREAGQITLQFFQRGIDVELKSDASPVTIADREAELYMRQRIALEFVSDAILGEEFPEKTGTSGYRWILDPIDGTKSFISGVPLYSTLIGIEHEGRSVVGVIQIPALDECVYAAKGTGAWYQRGNSEPTQARVSQKSKLSESLFCTSEVKTFYNVGRGAAYERLQAGSWLGRTWGDGYGYLMVATGRAELMVDPKMNVWDCAALQPVIEEAGGTFTDWKGEPTIYSGDAVATNGKVLDEVLAITREYPAKK